VFRLLVALGLAAATCALAGAASAHTFDAAPTAFSDTAGDSGTAADLTSVTVSNNDAGDYTFTVGTASTFVTPDVVIIYFDTDTNADTGSPSGAEYSLLDFESDDSWVFEKWNGTDWGDAPAKSTVHVRLSGDSKTLTFNVNKSEIGGGNGFDFYVYSGREDNDDDDYGPDGRSLWHYDFHQKVTLTLAAGRASAAKAGGSWVLGIGALRSDNGKLVGDEGTITCSATAGAVKLAMAQKAFVSGGGGNGSAAVCSFSVPKKLKGKTLHGSIAVTFDGSTVKKAFTAKAK
jgi:hypothetical protein